MKKLLLGSIVLTAFALAISLFQISSCTKTNAQQPATKPTTYPIEGLWTGAYTVDLQPGLGERYFGFSIKPDSTIIIESSAGGQQNLSVGKWTLRDSVFVCTVTSVYGVANNVNVTQTMIGKWDKSGKLTQGAWQTSGQPNNYGKFTLARIN
ncbi:hypothetical protein [Pinibacter aurantiacus]|uniref:Lipocalin-like domain-containing protein n=1 Tax=Pinibacter aurantiacus TaxID=2851599 RepID=A0A9E2SDN0_9BACT|nr:hypothetical protein [Pinibacter aurantiacus]MBV4359458.1 hypothetical protein [Pinibacter aurantiacus]